MTKPKRYVTEQEKYNEFLSDELHLRLFASGAELGKLLMDTFGLGEANARKVLSRAAAAKAIASSKPYTFGKGQYIYLYRENYLTVAGVMAISQTSRPPLYRLLRSMLDNGGILSHYEAMKITASPGFATSTKVETLEDMIKVLSSMGMLRTETDERGVRYLLFKETPYNSGVGVIPTSALNLVMGSHYAKMQLDAALIPDILRWLYRSNLIDNTRMIYRDKKNPQTGAVHNQLFWDAFSYTKATGINATLAAASPTLEKQTMVALDIVLSRPYAQEDLDGFLGRIQINLHSVKTGHRKVLPMIFYRQAEELVLNRIAKLGIIAFDIGAVFGQKIYEVLQSLSQLAFSGEDSDIEKVVRDVLRTIRKSGQDDMLRDLKGTLFETLMYPVLKNLYPDATLTRGKTLVTKRPGADDKAEVEKYEYDYIIRSENPRELIFVELKGYLSTAMIPLGDRDHRNTLSWFFRRTLPFGKGHFPHDIADRRVVKAIYMTTGRFDMDGQIFIDEQNKGGLRSANALVAYDRHDLLEMLKKKGFTHEVKIVRKYYTDKSKAKKAVIPGESASSS